MGIKDRKSTITHMNPKIGEVFSIRGKTFTAVRGNSCEHCDIRHTHACIEVNCEGSIIKEWRINPDFPMPKHNGLKEEVHTYIDGHKVGHYEEDNWYITKVKDGVIVQIDYHKIFLTNEEAVHFRELVSSAVLWELI